MNVLTFNMQALSFADSVLTPIFKFEVNLLFAEKIRDRYVNSTIYRVIW